MKCAAQLSRALSFFLSALLLVSSLPADEPTPTWKLELAVLKTLSRRLSTEVAAQALLLQSSSDEIENLKQKLEGSEKRIANIEKLLSESTESIATLRQEMDGLRISLEESQTAFDAWKKASQEKIRQLETERFIYRLAAIIGLGAAAGALIADWPGAGIGAGTGVVLSAVLEIASRRLHVIRGIR